jgi:tRNA threonylcarbamoyladenosine biosynthesis protein TsaE
MSAPQTFESEKLSDLRRVAREIITLWELPVLLVHGPMGAGKTTLAKALCDELQVTDTVSSPTFSLVNEYKTKHGATLYHFDFYRIEDDAEAIAMGFDHYLETGNKCIIEWGDKIERLLPESLHLVRITPAENRRIFQFNTITP